MKRRDLFAVGAGGALAAALPGGVGAAADAPEAWDVGAFRVLRHPDRLTVEHSGAPGRTLWETATDPDGFLVAEVATMTVEDVGTPQGAFEIGDKIAQTYGHAAVDAVTPSAGGLAVTGTVSDATGATAGFTLAFAAVSDTHLGFTVSAAPPAINRITLRLASVPAEAIFGFGMQMTYVDQKGHLLPIVVQEHGVGRGSPIVTQLIDTFANRGGGTPYTTEAPVPQFVTSRLRSMFLENTEVSRFDMRPALAIEAKVWAPVMKGRIVFGETPIDIVAAYSDYAGRMPALPDWVHEGVIACVQGGTEAVRGKLAALNGAGVPLAGLWIQDWSGVRVTSVGAQLWWNWTLDEQHYPGWKQLLADLEAQGARLLTYVNPFLSHEDGHDGLYLEAKAKGYLVLDQDGTPFLNKNTTFTAALIDLSNPAARDWIKGVIKTNMIAATGTSGWMQDFGEALPFDGRIAGGDPASFHNRYPVEWARVGREAIEEAGRAGDILTWHRSGYTQSPAQATAFWLGDQLQSWDEYDGIKSAVVGMLTSGVSGYSLVHSDTGGYNALKVAPFGVTIPVITRSPELFMRWMELGAFTAIFRTHEGLDPAISPQFDTSPALLAHLGRFARVYKALGPYRRTVVAEAARRGTPVVRHPFLHYPDDANTIGLRYQFLLGPDVMVAPVVDKGAASVTAYFPAADAWTDLWTGAAIGTAGDWAEVEAPLGRPGVFLRQGGAASAGIRDAFAAAGLLG